MTNIKEQIRAEQYKLAVLCAHEKSNYFLIPNIDIYTEKRNAFTFSGSIPIIAHPPCAQWSRLKRFAKKNQNDLDIASFCIEKINENGGCLEQPNGSSLFKHFGITKNIYQVDQHYFGFEARKKTLIWFNGFKPLPHQLNFDAIKRSVSSMSSKARSLTTLSFNEWLVNSIAP